MRGWLAYLIAGLMLIAFPLLSRASIIATAGSVQGATPPLNLSTGAWESNTAIRAFAEMQNLSLPQAINVDITVPGTSPNAIDSNLSAGVIAAGTRVHCYSLHFDVVGAPSTGNAIELTGSVTVGDDILALIVESNHLTATNSILGLANTSYPFGADYGLELTAGGVGTGTSDSITLTADHRTVLVDWRTASSSDNIRIITAVPEPGAALLLLGIATPLIARIRKPRRT